MGRYLVFLPVLLLSAAVIFHEAKAEPNPVVSTTNYLGIEIHKRLSAQGGNVFFSPLSISTVLGMVFYGARGHTAQNMRSALGFRNASLTDDEVHTSYKILVENYAEEPVEDYHLYMANAALIQKGYPIVPSYKTGLQNIYQATVKEVDSANKTVICREVNEWVKEKTHNQIKGFLKEKHLNERNPLILLNAVYFKGSWEKEFRSARSGVFYNQGLESKKTNVQMMGLLEQLPYARIDDLQVVEMPYKGGHVSMVILLPDAMDGLTELEKNLTPDTFRDMRRRTSNTRVILSFPKFQLKFKKEMKKVLQNLGVNVFGGDADFSGICAEERLKVSKVLHQATIKVNEKGTVAAAVTSVLIMPMSANYAKHVTVNHPFLFAIVDVRSDMLLFVGRVDTL